MPLITVYSPKGGVGKTTLAANLCYSLAATGLKAVAIDFDPQNSLRLHFGVPLTDQSGFAATAAESAEWSQHVLSNRDNVFVLPFGKTTAQERSAFERRLVSDELFLSRGLSALLRQPNLIVIADLPPGYSAVLDHLLPLSDVLLVPLLADTASLALLPEIEQLIEQETAKNPQLIARIILNQVDYRRKVNKEIESFLQERLEEKLLGIVHRDESVVEANAEQKSLIEVNRASVAAFDVEVLGNRIAEKLGIEVGNGTMDSHTVSSQA